MNVLVVFAHNEPRSFNATMKDAAVEYFQETDHNVIVSDLYAMNFNPVASSSDFTQRSNPDYLVYALEQRNAYATGSLAADIAAEIEKVKWADSIARSPASTGGAATVSTSNGSAIPERGTASIATCRWLKP